MTLELNISGGFTGKAGTRRIIVNTDRLKPGDAESIHREIEQLPDDTWGGKFLSPHPKSWDFLHKLLVTQDDKVRTVEFHLNQGPLALTGLVETMKNIDAQGNADSRT